MKFLAAAAFLLLVLACLGINELAELNYNLARCEAARSVGSDSDNAFIMQKHGFVDSTGTEISEPAKVEKIQALIISL